MQYYNEKRLETTQITIDKNWLNKWQYTHNAEFYEVT
jgi:hypothetical protein